MDDNFLAGLWAWGWFVAAGGLFLLTFIFGIKKQKKKNLKAALKTFLLGIVIVDFIMLSTLIYYGNVYTENKEPSAYNSVKNKDADKPFALLHSSEFEITSEEKLPFAIIYGFINAPKMGAFGMKYPSLFDAAFRFPWCLGVPFGIGIIILTIVTPLIFGGFLVSYIKNLWNFLAYRFQRRRKDVYYFSDLNEKSILLGEDIVKDAKDNKKSKPLIVFCNWNKIPSAFADRIDRNHFIVLPENEKDLIVRFTFGRKRQYFFEISDDDNLNLEATNELINRLMKIFKRSIKDKKVKEKNKSKKGDNKPKKSNKSNKKKGAVDYLKVYLFMDTALFGSEKLFESDQKKINIILVDKIKMSVYNLLFKKPLCYEIDNNDKSLSIAVFGNGVYAKEFFKDSIWASVLGDKYTTRISFIDKNADSFEKKFRLNCPSLFPDGNDNEQLRFFPIDLQSDKLKNLLVEKIQHPNYIVIDTGNDVESINLAIYLRMFYIRQSIREETKIYTEEELSKKTAVSNFVPYKPFIAVRIKDSKTSERIKKLRLKEKKENTYDFYSFGSDKEIYSYELIVESPIEKLALNCHAAYSASYNKEHGYEKAYEDKSEAVFGCNISEFDKCSNRASAVHIKNKLFRMGIKLKSSDEIDSQDVIIKPEEAKKKISDYIKDDDKMMELQKFEHERWSLFHFSEGWDNTSFKETLVYRKLLEDDEEKEQDKNDKMEKKHKYVLARLHGCLCSWESLNIIEKEYEKFKIYDEVFIRDIPSILGIENENPKPLNIAEVKFLFVERNSEEANNVHT